MAPSCFALQVPDVQGSMLQRERDVELVTELYLECNSVSGHAHHSGEGVTMWSYSPQSLAGPRPPKFVVCIK